MISNCIFTWAITRKTLLNVEQLTLWIDFKLYFYVSNHKTVFFNCIIYTVVNWFQIVFLREQSQDNDNFNDFNNSCELISNCIFTWAITSVLKMLRYQVCCELISNCIFTWAITSLLLLKKFLQMLWIDFKLYFYVSNHKVNPKILSKINTLGFLF